MPEQDSASEMLPSRYRGILMGALVCLTTGVLLRTLRIECGRGAAATKDTCVRQQQRLLCRAMHTGLRES